jgi:hypothetical protein
VHPIPEAELQGLDIQRTLLFQIRLRPVQDPVDFALDFRPDLFAEFFLLPWVSPSNRKRPICSLVSTNCLDNSKNRA